MTGAGRSWSGAEGMNDLAAVSHAAATGLSRLKPRLSAAATGPSAAVRPRRAALTPAHRFGPIVAMTTTVIEVGTTEGVTIAPIGLATAAGTGAVGIGTGGIGGTVVRTTAMPHRG